MLIDNVNIMLIDFYFLRLFSFQVINEFLGHQHQGSNNYL